VLLQSQQEAALRRRHGDAVLAIEAAAAAAARQTALDASRDRASTTFVGMADRVTAFAGNVTAASGGLAKAFESRARLA